MKQYSNIKLSIGITVVLLFFTACKASVLEADFEKTTPYNNEKFAFSIDLPQGWHESKELSNQDEHVLTNLSQAEVAEFKQKQEQDKNNWGFLPFHPFQRHLVKFYETENLSMYECIFEGKIRPECGDLPELTTFETKNFPGLIEVNDQYFQHFIYFPIKQGTVLVAEFYPEPMEGRLTDQYFKRMLSSLEIHRELPVNQP